MPLYTTLELSEEFGVSKMQVYRFFQKADIKHVTELDGKYFYNNEAVSIAKQHFIGSQTTSTVTDDIEIETEISKNVVLLLQERVEDYKKQLETKDIQLFQANERETQSHARETELQKLLNQQQQLQMQTQQQTQKLLEESEPKRKWWQFPRAKED